MQALQNGRFAVSTWSLHRMLGATYPYSPDPQKSAVLQEPYGPGTVSLLEVPRMLAERGLGRLEVCSFHLPSLDASYLAEMRDVLKASNILFQTLLVEDGDPSNAETAERDIDWIAGWIDIAKTLGAERRKPRARCTASEMAGRAGGRQRRAHRHRKLVRPSAFAEGDELATGRGRWQGGSEWRPRKLGSTRQI